MSKWEQMELDLGLDDDEAEDQVEVDAFIKGALEGRIGNAPPPPNVPQTAFVVVINAEGDAEAYADPRQFPKYTLRPASLGDIRRACNEIVTEINLQTGARITAHAINPTTDPQVQQTSIRAALHDRGIDVRE